MEQMAPENENNTIAGAAHSGDAAAPEVRKPITLRQLFMLFFRVSAVTFGGGIVILGMVKLEVEKRKDISQEELDDMVSLAGSVPGPIAVSISWLFGRRQRGLPGALAAVTGAILPPFLIVLFLSPFILKYSGIAAVQGFFKGVLCGTSALIFITIFSHVRGTFAASLWNIVPFAAIIVMIGVLQVHPFAAMVAATALQVVRERVFLR